MKPRLFRPWSAQDFINAVPESARRGACRPKVSYKTVAKSRPPARSLVIGLLVKQMELEPAGGQAHRLVKQVRPTKAN